MTPSTPDTPKAQTPNAQGDALRALLEQVYGMAREGCRSPAAAYRWCERIDEVMHAGRPLDDYEAYALDLPAALASSPAPVGEAGSFAWTKRKPTRAGAYGARGYELFVPAQEQFEAIVAVRRNDDGELVCNLHANTSEDDFDLWYPVAVMTDELEWLEFAPALTPPERPEGQGDRDA